MIPIHLHPLLRLSPAVLETNNPRQDHFRAKIRIVLSKLCRKFGFEEIKVLMPEHDKKLVAHMQTIAEREVKAKKTRLAGGRGGGDNVVRGNGGGDDGEGGITKALRTFDTIMEGKCCVWALLFVSANGIAEVCSMCAPLVMPRI